MAGQISPHRGPSGRRVLAVTGDPQLATLIQKTCTPQGWDVNSVGTAAEVTDEDAQAAYMVIIDVSGKNDEAAISTISELSPAPVLALTESSLGIRNSSLLRAGADLILGKPFNSDDLMAHFDALSRRTIGPQPYVRRYEYDDLVVDFVDRTVTVGGQRVKLTSTQHRLVEFLSRHAGAICTLRQISEAIWGPEYEATPAVIRSHIMNTRKALGDSSEMQHYIRTDNGLGYWMPRPGT